MLPIQGRRPLHSPYRTIRPITSKIIFVSCEGSVTEEEYFCHISQLFDGIKGKIQVISVAEDAFRTRIHLRSDEQNRMFSKTRPRQLLDRIEQFKIDKNSMYQFSEYPDDEFWIVSDVDKNWSNEIINPREGKTYREEWEETIALCQERNYGYAISNPFFEMWLLLHHDSPTLADKMCAVTNEQAYDKEMMGTHFTARLKELGVSLKKQKHINASHYTFEKVMKAIDRAEELHQNRTDLYPHYFATTVYIIINKMKEMLPENKTETNEDLK